MYIADDGSNLWSFDDFTAADDDMHLSMDVQSFLDILEESPNPSQNFPEDVTLKNVPQDGSTSFGGNNSLIRSGGPVLKVASSSGAELVVSATLSPSYNSEVSESRTGGSDGSFDSVGNSVLDIDVGKFEPSAHVGSPVHSQSGSLADWIPPTIGHDTTPAGRDGIASSCGRYRGEEIQLKMPSCSTPFSFSAADANYVSENREALDFNHLDGETGPHFKCLEADSQYKYAFQDSSVDNRGVSYGKYCNSSKNSLKTSGIPDIMEPSIMYVDASLYNAYYSSSNVCEIPDVICGTGSQYPVLRYCMTTDNTSFASPSTQYLADNSFQLLSNDDEMMINMKDDVVELPTQNSFLSNTMIFGTHVGRAGGTVSQSPAIGNSNIRELSSECYGSNHMALRTALDAGRDLGMPDDVLINGKGPYGYNNSLVPDGIDYETINVETGLDNYASGMVI